MTGRPPSVAELARSEGEGWCEFLAAAVHGHRECLLGANLGIGGEPLADMNWAIVYGPDGVADAIRDCVRRIRERGLPGVVNLVSTVAAEGAPVAAELGLVRGDPNPLMCVRAADARRAETEIKVRRAVDTEDLLVAGDVLGDAYDTPVDWCQRMLGAGPRPAAGAEIFLGCVDGRAVSVAGTACVGAVGGVYAVGTRKAYRRRGAASAAVSAAIDHCVAKGAHWCVLFSEPDAEPVYAGLGFVVVDRGDQWSVEGS